LCIVGSWSDVVLRKSIIQPPFDLIENQSRSWVASMTYLKFDHNLT